MDPLLIKMQDQAAQWEAKGDLRFIFLRCYAIMSANMLKGIEEGRFRDPDWVVGLLHRFAEYYFEALQRYEVSKQDVPAVWKQVHDASLQQELHVMQHLLLGVNAHINYDLVLALYDALSPDWRLIDSKKRDIRHQDHVRVNQIIRETIDAVQDQVVERQAPFMAVVDRLMGRVDEWILAELIAGWRSDVWNETGIMLTAESDEQREKLRKILESKVMKKASQMLSVG